MLGTHPPLYNAAGTAEGRRIAHRQEWTNLYAGCVSAQCSAVPAAEHRGQSVRARCPDEARAYASGRGIQRRIRRSGVM
jgi:hypothetical protein